MARFVRHFRISPSDYWALTLPEDRALDALYKAELAGQRRQAAKAKRKK